MITIEPRDNRRFEVLDAGSSIGMVSASVNPFHACHAYLDLELTAYDPAWASELFAMLRAELGLPLQAMLDSRETEKIRFVTAGGFQRRRRCFEMVVGEKDLVMPVQENIPIRETKAGEEAYQECCALLYGHYARTHMAISPLTADRPTFDQALPEHALYYAANGAVEHCAFVEESEIAYVGMLGMETFHVFAEALLARMLGRYKSISFEADSTDPAAMELREFFHHADRDSFDTFILDG